ncbi:MAG: hypothetical protein JKX81_09450 [Arenicella sp.]|nr:hypothetical protein [Arenicella sp.]
MTQSAMFTSGALNMVKFITEVVLAATCLVFAGYAYAGDQYAKSQDTGARGVEDEVPAAAKISLANGEKNWIIVDGVTRDDKTLTFAEVHIDGNGWLVLHPFEGGKPNGDKYVAASYVQSGSNKNVDINVHKGVETGEMFIVMLHRDVNQNKVLDFVFTSDTGVMDEAVFEGSTMVAHVVSAP